MVVYLPLGNGFIVASLDGIEQTPGAATIHDLTVMPYGRPGKRFAIVHSLLLPSQLFWAFPEPSPFTSTEYDNLLFTSSASFSNPTVIVLIVRRFRVGAANSSIKIKCHCKHGYRQIHFNKGCILT